MGSRFLFRRRPDGHGSPGCLTLAGTPATSEPGGICMPCGTTAPATFSEPAPPARRWAHSRTALPVSFWLWTTESTGEPRAAQQTASRFMG